MKNPFNMRLLFIALLITGIAASNIYAEDQCVTCHKNAKFRIQNKVLSDYYSYWEESVHESAGTICIDCHGGDEIAPDKNAAHKTKDFSSLAAGDRTTPKKIALVCGKCHKAVYRNFKASKHYIALQKDMKGPNCVTCHGSMNTETYNANNIADGCASCHNKGSKDLPEVSGHAENLLTRISIIRAYRKWAMINYNDNHPEIIKDINTRYRDMVLSWHQFDLKQMDEKTQKLLLDLRSIVNKGLAEKRNNN